MSIFVPGGDIRKPVREYDNSLAMLRDIAEIGHNIEDAGIAAHPEGHPLVGHQELLRLLNEKQQFATSLVTQMCFDPRALVDWLKTIKVERTERWRTETLAKFNGKQNA